MNGELNADAVPMTPALIEALAGLRELHLVPLALPEPPAAVPWVLLGGLGGLLLLVVLIVLGYRLRHRHRLAAQRELAALRAAFGRDGDAAALAAGVNLLLKRAAARRAPGDGVSPAALSGAAWQAFLLQQFGRAGGPAQWQDSAARLADLPYRRQTALGASEADALLDFAASCLDVLLRPGFGRTGGAP